MWPPESQTKSTARKFFLLTKQLRLTPSHVNGRGGIMSLRRILTQVITPSSKLHKLLVNTQSVCQHNVAPSGTTVSEFKYIQVRLLIGIAENLLKFLHQVDHADKNIFTSFCCRRSDSVRRSTLANIGERWFVS